jgi:PAS domain S-box-containing protein
MEHLWDDVASPGAAWLQVLAGCVAEGVAVVDRQERVILVNPRLCRWLGRRPGELLGRRATEVWPASLRERCALELRRVLRGEPVETQEQWPGAGGPRPVSILKAPLRDEGGEVCAALLVLREPGGERQARAARRPAAPLPEPPRTGPSILVVEENAAVRQLVQTVLGRAGYRVVAVGCGEEALERCRQGPEEFTLVLLERQLPGLSAAQTLRLLRMVVPDARVVLSGAGTAPEEGEEVQEQVQGVLRKPYDAGQLLAAVAAALGRDEPGGSKGGPGRR